MTGQVPNQHQHKDVDAMWARMRGRLEAGRLMWHERFLTLFAKTLLIIIAEILMNALVWFITAMVFTHSSANQEKIFGLALVAWTTGLRHGLDADHISGE